MTDQPIHVGQRLEINAVMWEVVREEASENSDVDFRFILRLADSGFAERFTEPT